LTNWIRIIAAVAFFPVPVLVPGSTQSASSELTIETKVLTIFAASSLGPAIEEIAVEFGQKKDLEVRISIASSAALARQIEKGAPADIFVSADRRWIRYLTEKIQLSVQNVSPIATNRLVVAARGDRVGAEKDAARALLGDPDTWIAVGDPALSPLGAYTLEALRTMEIEAQLSGRLAYAADARAAVAFLQAGGASLAILYESDVRSARHLEIVARLNPSFHRPIVYSAVAIRPSVQTSAFIEYLTGPTAQEVFTASGFRLATPKIGQE
jgi:molybdate transport system substrate-binding protein